MSNSSESDNNNNKNDNRKCRKKECPHIIEIIQNQIFGPTPSIKDFPIEVGQEKIMFTKFNEAVLQYKKDSKNFFVGEFLNQCSKKRTVTDKWYDWNKEMISDIDRNESIMKKVLLEHGHEYVQDIMNESDGWNSSIEEMIGNLMEGLESIENRIDQGMMTIWGKVKDRGVVLNSIKSNMKMILNEDRKYDIIDYVNYKNKKWEEHYKKKKEKRERSKLYY